MNKLQLPTVTLLIVDCLNVKRAAIVIEKCTKLCDFGAVKFLTSLPTDHPNKIEIMPLNTLVMYSIFMLTECHKYIDTPHVLIVQRDGFILNPQSFNQEWLKYDYIAPLFIQYDRVGSGGFSLRSRYLMQNLAANIVQWDGTQKHADEIQEAMGCYEDGVICLSGRFSHFKIAPKEEACMFAVGGNRNPKYYREKPFGFHGAWHDIDFETGFVNPICEHADGHCLCLNGIKTYLKSMEK